MIKVNGIEVTKGCTVKLRCGAEVMVFEAWFENGKTQYNNNVKFNECDRYISYTDSGSWNYTKDPHPFDIIEVIPPAFDWDDVKVGMAFLDMDKEVVWYAAPFYTQEKSHVIAFQARNSSDGTLAEPRGHFKDCLTRAPEHDLEDIT